MKISIITVCYNAEKTIRDAMESVLRQRELFDCSDCSDCSIGNRLEIEHIVVDGGSTDGTVREIENFAKKVKSKSEVEQRRFSFRWVSEKDRGMYDALNKGMRMATGDVIGILNADDVLAEDDVLARIARVFERSDRSIDGCYGDIRFVREGVVGVEGLRGLRTVRYCSGHRLRDMRHHLGGRRSGQDPLLGGVREVPERRRVDLDRA